jgi:hypothetical protein
MNYRDKYPRSSQEAFGMRSYAEDFEPEYRAKKFTGGDAVLLVLICVGLGWLLWTK